jgi:putative peptidoglycan lipid II flippase
MAGNTTVFYRRGAGADVRPVCGFLDRRLPPAYHACTMTTAPASASEAAPVPPPRPGVARAVGSATLQTIFFVLLSRVLGVVRSMAIAHALGQKEITDIYNRAFTLPDMMYLLLAGGMLSTVFMPLYNEFRHAKNDEEGAKRFLGMIVTLVTLAAIVLVIIAEIFAYPLGRLVAPKFTDTQLAAMVPLTRILLPAQVFFFVGGIFVATLQSRDRWLIPNLAPLIYNLGTILGALLFANAPMETRPYAMTWGAVIGAALGNFLLPLYGVWREGLRWRPGFNIQDPYIRRFGVLLLPALLGLGLSQLGFHITGWFRGADGELTALRNGYELTQAPIGIFAQASALVLYPTLTRLAAEFLRKAESGETADWTEYRDAIHFGFRRILFLTVPASLLMAVLAEPIIALLYSGPQFGVFEIERAAVALRLYSLGTFAWSGQAVLGRGFAAMQDTKTPLSITKYMIVLLVALCFLSSEVFRLPFGALALSMSMVGTVNMVWLMLALSRRLGGLNVREIIKATVRILAAAAVSSGIAYALTAALTPSLNPTGVSKMGSLLILLAAGGLGVIVYVGASVVLRVPELRTVREMFRRPKNAPATEPAD